MKTNLYSLVLGNWYHERFNDYTQVKKSSEFRKYYYSHSDFLRAHRSLHMNLGRQQGATTAIANFIKKHPELNIRVVFAKELLAKEFARNHDIDISKHKLSIGMNVESIDIIFMDDDSYRRQFTSAYQEDIYQSIISRLNTGVNANQWLISFC